MGNIRKPFFLTFSETRSPGHTIGAFVLETLKDIYVTFNLHLATQEWKRDRAFEFVCYQALRLNGKKRIAIDDTPEYLMRVTGEKSRFKVCTALRHLTEDGWLRKTEFFYYPVSQLKLLDKYGITDKKAGEYRGEKDPLAFMGITIIGAISHGINRSKSQAGKRTDAFGRRFKTGEVSTSMIRDILGLTNRMAAHRLQKRAIALGYISAERGFECVPEDIYQSAIRADGLYANHFITRSDKRFRRLPNTLTWNALYIGKRRGVLQ